MAFNVGCPQVAHAEGVVAPQARSTVTYAGWTTKCSGREGWRGRGRPRSSAIIWRPDGGFSAAADTAECAAVVENLQEDATSGATCRPAHEVAAPREQKDRGWPCSRLCAARDDDARRFPRRPRTSTKSFWPFSFGDPGPPDVRALRLRDDRKAPRNFHDPPLLRVDSNECWATPVVGELRSYRKPHHGC